MECKMADGDNIHIIYCATIKKKKKNSQKYQTIVQLTTNHIALLDLPNTVNPV